MAMEVLQNGMPSESTEFTPCSICGRTFNPEVLARHQRVCSKNQKLAHKRPVFDTSKKRREGTDLQSFLASRPYLNTKKPSTAEIRAAEKKKNWRRKHEDFISCIRSAKDYTEAEATGKSIPLPRPSKPNPDYVQCPHCGRRFEEFAAERHMPFCKEKHSRIERRSQDNKAMDKLNKRIQYKPPKLKKKSGDQDATPSKKSQPHGNPPGYHLVPKKSNFSGTYTLEEENSPERQRGSYQSQYRAGGRHGGGGGGGSVVRAPVPKSFSQRMMTSSHTSATPAGELPGSSSDPWMRGHERVGRAEGERGGRFALSEVKQIKKQRSQLKTPQSVVAGFASSHHHHHSRGFDGGREGGVGRVRQIRRDGEIDREHHSSSSFGGDGDPMRLAPVKPKGKSRSLRVQAVDSPPLHQDLGFDFANGGSGSEGRAGSGSSLGGGGNRKGIPLNQHGMSMSKFCYECGARYPVPQAKYCCECGTKRI